MATENVKIQLSTSADLKGFKEVETAATKLNKTIKNLAKTFGYAYGTQVLGKFAKDSINAFIADEEAANRLSLAVKNLGMEFANPYITDYIKKLEQTSKVADDQLRPAFQSLLQQTASLSKSQSILNTAIEVSRGSGVGLSEVANDLAQAYVGNTRGLKKYYLGLSQAELKAKSFSDIQSILNNQFAGSSAAYLSTYSGQVGVLSLAWQNFQESVGGALLTMASFGEGSQSKGLSNLATILNFISKSVTAIATGWNSVAKLLNVTNLTTGVLGGFNPAPKPSGDKAKPESVFDKYSKLLKQIEDNRIAQNKIILANQKKLTAEQKKQALLKKQSALFDMEQIQLVAALKGKLSDEDRKRAELQLALLQGDEDTAKRLTAQIADAIDKTGNLKAYLNSVTATNDPFGAWMDSLEKIAAKAASLAKIGSNMGTTTLPDTNIPAAPTWNVGGTAIGTGNIGGQVQVSVNFQGADSLSQALRDSFVSASMDGSFSQINRTVGAFDR